MYAQWKKKSVSLFLCVHDSEKFPHICIAQISLGVYIFCTDMCAVQTDIELDVASRKASVAERKLVSQTIYQLVLISDSVGIVKITSSGN